MVGDNLEKCGFVRRERNAHDRRLSRMRLIEKVFFSTSTRRRRGDEYLDPLRKNFVGPVVSLASENTWQRVVHFMGRLFLAAIFLWSGVGKIVDWQGVLPCSPRRLQTTTH